MADTEFVERRQCNLHGEEHLRSCMNADNIEKLEKSVNNRIPLWILWPCIGLMISILGFQWATYDKVSNLIVSLDKRISVLESRQNDLRDSVYGAGKH